VRWEEGGGGAGGGEGGGGNGRGGREGGGEGQKLEGVLQIGVAEDLNFGINRIHTYVRKTHHEETRKSR